MSKSKDLVRVILLILLISLVVGQRGGGGGGGGGGSGGGGGGSSGGSHIYGGNGKSCSEKCGKTDKDCIKRCQSTGVIVGGVFGGILGIFCILGCCNLYYYKCRNQSTPSPCAGCFLCPRCPCSKYQSLKRSYNILDPGPMSVQQFNSKKQDIMLTLNRMNNNNNFFIYQGKETIKSYVFARVVKEKQFLTELELTGTDSVGSWKAKGFILCRDEGKIFIWFYKIYDDLERAGQTSDWEHLVYESTKIQHEHLEGKWFYLGFENNCTYSGTWSTDDHKVTSAGSEQGIILDQIKDFYH